MDTAFSHLEWWLWSRKNQESILSDGSSTNSSADSGMKELDALSIICQCRNYISNLFLLGSWV
ncbi:hypothetical protein Lalb_Chr15g0080811 [Lupinus albus]|uniref:Uncharacterized protein n=1 Tax=Lupinus albus TaxID=3870 RepID=A0A6A4PEB4_LUPAL|nr:hypothetical protein Lalb_Chr15g0080811 [Lupinus albus]